MVYIFLLICLLGVFLKTAKIDSSKNMCGIWLLCGLHSSDSLHCNNAFTKISHRGPDAWRLEMDVRMNNILLGFHRLSIVDKLHGMQPMRLHAYPHLYLLCNGEIYNYKRLAKDLALPLETSCDVEVILHLYAKGGIAHAASSLDGEFAFCIIDMLEHEVHVARDPFGVRPSFILRTDNGVLGICSEAKGLVSMGKDTGAKNWNVEQFPPGTYETYKVDRQTGLTKQTEQKRYYEIGVSKPSFATAVPIPGPEGDVLSTIQNLFTEAVRKRLMADRRIGCLLSGGLDSSLVAALLVKLAKEANVPYRIQTFSIGMENSPDLAAARQVADHIGSEHHEIVFTENDVSDILDDVLKTLETADITTVRASIGMYLLSKYIRQKADSVVILSGEGADEVAQGYIYFRDAPSASQAHEESVRLLKDVHKYDGLRADRTTSKFSLELRLPFLDLAFTSYFLSLPQDIRQPVKGVEKHLLRSAFANTGLLPDNILWRPKEAFSDGVAALKKSLFQIVQEIVDRRIGDVDVPKESAKFDHCPPKTKESLYYRLAFENEYGGQAKALMPYFWMPKWTQVDDPSARFIKHYNAATE